MKKCAPANCHFDLEFECKVNTNCCVVTTFTLKLPLGSVEHNLTNIVHVCVSAIINVKGCTVVCHNVPQWKKTFVGSSNISLCHLSNSALP